MTQDVGFKYTDTVFRLLFSDRQRLMSLYNALCHDNPSRQCVNPALVTAKLLDGAICVEVQGGNLLFIADVTHVYARHSLWSPNIPLFFFNYYVKELQRIARDQMSYVTDSMNLPPPCFAVLYNGDVETEDKQLLRLSDAYKERNADCSLDLTVQVYNVNAGHNADLLAACDTLKDYSEFVRRVREATRANTRLPVDKAVERAVNSCIKDGVLRDFLQTNRRDVIAIGIYEFDTGEKERLVRKAGYEDGQYDLLYELVKEGHIPLAVAAKKAGQHEEDFARDMKMSS